MDNNKSTVSIIIPCRNEEKFIGKCLDSIIPNDYPRDKLEVLVADGMSQDGTREIVKKYAERYPFIRILDNPNKIIPAAVNIGIKQAKGEIIMRMDAHATYEKDYISKCVKYLDEYQVDNVGGVMITVPREDTLLAKPIVLALTSLFGVGNARFRIGSKKPILVDTVFGGCYRKELFKKIGMLNEKVKFSEDLEFNLRLKRQGGRILLVPDIKSYYYALSDFFSFCQHNFRNGVWALYPIKFTKHLPLSLRHLVPLIFVLSLIGLAGLSLLSKTFAWLFLSLVATYGLTNLYFSSQIVWKQKNIFFLGVMPAVFASLHLIYGLGSIFGVFKVILPQNSGKTKSTNKIYQFKEGKLEWFETSAELGRSSKLTIKRLFDFIFSLIGVMILLPVFVVVGLLIKLGSQGPVFYRGLRVGRFGKPFKIFKFRTMVQNAEKLGGSSTPNDDPRLTTVGKFLRQYKLDEIPQLLNVLKGEMSFVGPRPQVPEDVALYTESEKALLSVLPGITDWASIKFYNEGEILKGSSNPDQAYVEKIRPEKINLGLEYVKNHSLGMDLKILLMTFKTLFQRKILAK